MRRRRIIGSVLVSAIAAGALAMPAFAQSPSAEPWHRPPVRLHRAASRTSSSWASCHRVTPTRCCTNAQPLADYLTTALGIPVESFVPTDYTGLVVAMGTGQADIGALRAVRARPGSRRVGRGHRPPVRPQRLAHLPLPVADQCARDLLRRCRGDQGHPESQEDTPRDVTARLLQWHRHRDGRSGGRRRAGQDRPRHQRRHSSTRPRRRATSSRPSSC